MKKAFSMLEFIFVIVVLGILASVIIPRLKSTSLEEAAIQVASHIRYTQHLALVDDKYSSADPLWYKRRWQIVFGKSAYTDNEVAYTIFSDTLATASGNPDEEEIAKDPMNTSKRLTGGHSGTMHIYDDALRVTKEMNLGLNYGIKSYQLSGGCANARLAFDSLGRPMTGNLSSIGGPYQQDRMIVQRCKITLANDQESVTIAIEPETGYVHLLK